MFPTASRAPTLHVALTSPIQEELDRREQAIQSLTLQNQDLASTLTTLESELVVSHDESERASRELEAIRSRVLEDNAQEASTRERDFRELQAELERCRMERDEWERALLEERVALEEIRSSAGTTRRELEMERADRERIGTELERERENSANLQSVLEDFQSGEPQVNSLTQVNLSPATQQRKLSFVKRWRNKKYSQQRSYNLLQSSSLAHCRQR